MEHVKSLKEIVEKLRSCGYTCEAGPLENNADFQLLERIAGVNKYTLDGLLSQKPAPKSAQQVRDEIVEQAKRDIDDLKDVDGLYTVERGGAFNYACYSEFIVNKEKRTVVALLRGFRTKRIRAKGIAKCAPNDCFNSHIGRAIALRRALGLEVPAEYLNAPQPTEVRVGDVVQDVKFRNKLKIARKAAGNIYDAGGVFFYESRVQDGMAKIIDDSREEASECTQ